jgi:membrane peptidoglycan carboxypeptidase
MQGRRSIALTGAFLGTVLVGATILGTAGALVVPIAHRLATRSVAVKLPDPTLQPLELRSVVYDDLGNPVATLFGDQDRAYTPLQQISPVLQHAVLAAEDRNFYHHGGVDWRGVGRALTKNLDAGSVLQGGSTITQQLVKNTMFRNPKRDLKRKIKEAVLAISLEDKYSKSTILEQYLNTVYFGNGAYGVRSAAERYFQRTPANIDLGQAALLAAIVANPEQRDPLKHPDEAVRWRDRTLTEMVKARWATPAQAAVARTEPVPKSVVISTPRGGPIDSFVEEVKRELLGDPRLGETYSERYQRVFEGGLQIHTSLDVKLELLAQRAVQDQLPQGPYTAAMVVIDNTSGAVRAVVPGTSFQHAGFDLATQGLRQTGSSFKGITLAAALTAGFSPFDSVNASGHCTFYFPGSPAWDLHNYEGESFGTISLTDAIAKSSNCAFARVALAIGPQSIVDMAHKLGIARPLEAVPSITLGTQSVSPLDMATGYSTLAADGVRHNTHFIDRVNTSDGKVLFSNQPDPQQVLDPQIARTETWMLTHVVRNGTAAGSLGDFPRPAAGKTGTNDQHRDAWFVGYTPQLTAAVWMGNPDAQLPIIVDGVRVVGGMYPAKIWGDFMAAALQDQPVLDFAAPDQSLWPAPGSITEFGRNAYRYRHYAADQSPSTNQTSPPATAPAVTSPPAPTNTTVPNRVTRPGHKKRAPSTTSSTVQQPPTSAATAPSG